MAIITVTNSNNEGAGSLREAIKIASSGDTIKFSSKLSNQSITLDSVIYFKKSLTIDGADATNLTISGGEKTNLLWLNKPNESLSVKNITLADSYNEEAAGGAIWAAGYSTIDIENTKFINNVSDGAALHALGDSNITVKNSTFDGNDGAKISDKGYSTGAISLFAYGSLTIEDSIFTNNKGYAGGALHITSSDLIIDNSVFIGNDSIAGADKDVVAAGGGVPGAGGAIYLDGASVPNDPRFYGSLPGQTNQGEAEGGEFIVRNSRFENNRGAGEGGAIVAYGYNQDRILIQDSEIVNNEVITNMKGFAKGGGLWLSGFVEIDNVTIANNKSADLGGGLFMQGEVPAKISNSNFSSNQAVNGGAIYSGHWNSDIEVYNTDFDSNIADEGGVYTNVNRRPITFQNSRFNNNSSGDFYNFAFDRNVPDIVFGTYDNDNLVGNDRDSYLAASGGEDTLSGNGGNDYLNGGENYDTLDGGAGNDTLVGGDSGNYLIGGGGNDVFIGGDGQDLIEGGKGRDIYVIGDENQVYYSDYPWWDHAIITDFEPAQDIIQLKGSSDDYSINPANSQGIYGTGIFYQNSMVALIGDVSPANFDLNAGYVSYGSLAESQMLFSEVTNDIVSYPGIELDRDSLFSGKPNYNPANYDGLVVWNEGNTWYIEATGDVNGSQITGRILANNPIENFAPYLLEESDKVEFVDSSRQVIDFDLRIGQKWTDGISFTVSNEDSIFLDLGENSDVTVTAGANLQQL